jgi:hypothetical protein
MNLPLPSTYQLNCHLHFQPTHKLLIVAFFFAMLWSAPAHAQIVNVMGMLDVDKQGLFVDINGNVDWRSGNVNFALVEGGFLVRLIYNNHMFLTTGKGAYGIKDDARFVGRGFGHMRYRYQFLPWIAGEVYGQAEYDEFRRYSLRGLVGGGVVLSWEYKKSFEIAVGSTYMFEVNQFSGDFTYPGGGQEQLFHRWNNYLYLDIALQKHLRLVNTTYIQPFFSDFGDWRLLVDTTLSIKLWKWLSLTVSHILAYQSRPPVSPTATVAALDNVFKVGLSSRFFLWKPTPPPTR